MAFEWNRMYKWEENHERDITEDVEEYICENYSISSIEEMTPEQYKEVEAFYNEMNEYSIMRIGFNNVFNNWLNYREEEGLV
jgi:hypothetical protein